jgi:hypothetical protein
MSGRYSRATVSAESGECVYDITREIDPALSDLVYGLAMTAARDGLYVNPSALMPTRIDNLRVQRGFPADIVEAHKAYATSDELDTGRDWFALTAEMVICDSREKPVINPARYRGTSESLATLGV